MNFSLHTPGSRTSGDVAAAPPETRRSWGFRRFAIRLVPLNGLLVWHGCDKVSPHNLGRSRDAAYTYINVNERSALNG